VKEYINLSAGQTLLSPGCRDGLSRQMHTPIYYPDYYRAELEAAGILKRLLGTQSEVLILTGNATHAIEACLTSLLEPGEAYIAVNGGLFGQVFVEVGRAIGVSPVEIKVPFGDSVTPAQLDLALGAHPEAKAVSLVHIETSTGVICPLDELAQVVKDHDRLLIVDAVSSLGALPLEMDSWGVDVFISSGQKALNAPQGLAIVSASDRAWDAYQQRKGPVRSICLDLGVWREYRKNGVEAMLGAWQGQALPEITPSKIVHGPSPSGPLVFGLLGALKDLIQEGPKKVYRRHHIASQAVREGLKSLNLSVVAGEDVAAPSVTAAWLPKGITDLELRMAVYNEYQIALGAAPVEVGLNAVRLGTMGRAAHPQMVLPSLSALGNCLALRGHPCSPAAGIETARSIFDREIASGLWEMNGDESGD
jgi:alanine-glyoxylate transaminase / serine-glyoxylate transaminase / serine-pyruvate transaminase